MLHLGAEQTSIAVSIGASHANTSPETVLMSFACDAALFPCACLLCNTLDVDRPAVPYRTLLYAICPRHPFPSLAPRIASLLFHTAILCRALDGAAGYLPLEQHGVPPDRVGCGSDS